MNALYEIELAIHVFFLQIYFFRPNKKAKPALCDDITLGESTASLEVALDTDHIKSVKIVPLDESITTMYPLMEPAVKSVSNQLAAGVVPEEVELTKESKYTQQIIVDAVEEILEEQGAANQTVK